MSINTLLLPEFEHEMSGVRRVLERVPDDKLAWKAHPKSNTVGWVASHLANIPSWVEGTIQADEWDIHPVGEEPFKAPEHDTIAGVLEHFDANVATAKTLLAATDDDAYSKAWSLLIQGQPVLTSTKIGVVRNWVINHSIHHRAILTVYLRLNDIPVPGLYGPSGDE